MSQKLQRLINFATEEYPKGYAPGIKMPGGVVYPLSKLKLAESVDHPLVRTTASHLTGTNRTKVWLLDEFIRALVPCRDDSSPKTAVEVCAALSEALSDEAADWPRSDYDAI
jgi:hypothetical protein